MHPTYKTWLKTMNRQASYFLEFTGSLIRVMGKESLGFWQMAQRQGQGKNYSWGGLSIQSRDSRSKITDIPRHEESRNS